MAKSRPESVFARPRWSEGDAREVMTALARSGKSVSAFAEEHSLDPQRVYLWRRRLGVSAEATTFQEVLVQPSGRGRRHARELEGRSDLPRSGGQSLYAAIWACS
jgi:transposase-like protein